MTGVARERSWISLAEACKRAGTARKGESAHCVLFICFMVVINGVICLKNGCPVLNSNSVISDLISAESH